MKKVFISVINDLSTDQRLDRMAQTLYESGYEVTLLGRKLPESMPYQKTGTYSRRFRLPVNKGPLFYFSYNVLLFFYLLTRKKPDLLIAIDLDTLLPNYIVSRIRKIPLLYDSHEYFTEVPELVNRPRVRKAWEYIEKKTLPGVEYAMAVSDPISQSYREKYDVDFRTVMNLSRFREPAISEDFHAQYNQKYKIIYQGALNLGRGLQMLIKSVKYLDDTILIIAGDGDIREELKQLVVEEGLAGKVEFTGRLAPVQLHKITCNCNLGVSPEEDMGLNYRYALPNKIFDYIQGRIPVLCSDLPEMSKIVNENKIGEVIKDRDPEQLAQQISHMLEDKASKIIWKKNLESAARKLCWENEQKKLLDILHSIFS